MPLPADRPIIRVRTKGDIPPQSHSAPASLPVCALDGWNLAPLRLALADALEIRDLPSPVEPLVRRAFAQARVSLVAARDLLQPDTHTLQNSELIAHELRQALDALGELGAGATPDEVIGRVFSAFCVGK